MATISLNVYKKDNKHEVEKTYTADGYDLMLGTVEDFMTIIDVDQLNNNMAIAKMVIEGYSKVKPLLKDIFPDITDEELNRVKVNDVIRAIIQTGTAVAESLKNLKSGN